MQVAAKSLFSRVLLRAWLITASICGLSFYPTVYGDLIVSEYVEGSSNNKAIELFNTGTLDVDLSTIGLSIFFNGSMTATSVITVGEISGTLVPGAVFTVAHSSWALGGIINHSDAGLQFNGDDAIALFHTSLMPANYLDVIGQIGFDPGTEWGSVLHSTADNTIQRNVNILAGDTDGGNDFNPNLDPTTGEWRGFAQNSHTLGSHDGQFSTAAIPEAGAFAAVGLVGLISAGAVWIKKRRAGRAAA